MYKAQHWNATSIHYEMWSLRADQLHANQAIWMSRVIQTNRMRRTPVASWCFLTQEYWQRPLEVNYSCTKRSYCHCIAQILGELIAIYSSLRHTIQILNEWRKKVLIVTTTYNRIESYDSLLEISLSNLEEHYHLKQWYQLSLVVDWSLDLSANHIRSSKEDITLPSISNYIYSSWNAS